MIDEDLDIINKINSGQFQLYEQIIMKYEKPLFNFILQMVGNYHTAQDLTQECLVKAYKGLSSFKPQAKFSTWLYKIARNLCIDHYRKYKAVEPLTEIKVVNDHTPEEVFLSLEFNSDLRKAVMSLTEEYKVAFCLRTYQEMSYDEIAEIVGCPVGTVRSRLARAREILRKQLQSYFKEKEGEVGKYAL